MKKYLLIFSMIFFSACKDSIKAKIEYRTDNRSCEGEDVTSLIQNNEYWHMQKGNENKSAYLINESIDKAYEFTVRQIETTNDTIVKHNILKVKLSPGDEKWLGCTNYSELTLNVDSTIAPKYIRNVILTYTCTGQLLITNSKELEDE